ncbi:RES family NAD+ phosphorylase [Shewanella sp. 10N.286.54.B9]|uniref:RES family NAD+ phosphorylase n=1 Tax=Shewanella sp. 10N.286.54.B9 TaxID=3229719 RepID=UPI0035516359
MQRLLEKIQELRVLDLYNIKYCDLKNKVESIFLPALGSTTQSVLIKRGEIMYRVHTFKPEVMNHLYAPPTEKVIGFQRCNYPGYPMWYVSTCLERSLRECRTKAGDIVFVSKWEVKEDFLISDISGDLTSNYSNEVAIVYGFFADKFIQRVESTFSYEYKMTAAISDVLLNSWKRTPPSWGIRFPSVQSVARGENLALLPESISMFDFKCVEAIEVVDETRSVYSYKIIESLNNLSDDKFLWMK